MSLARFKGALVGAVVADCFGALFEGRPVVSMSSVLEQAEKVKKGKYQLQFTDDTAMARSVAVSLIEHKKFNARDMAMRFAQEHDREGDRGYGGNVGVVLEALLNPKLGDVFEPAAKQFDYSGSFGNGGAMRIVPAPLFAYKDNDLGKLVELVISVTKLTHTNVLGIHGAILQAVAVDHSLRLDQNEPLNVNAFIDGLVEVLEPIEEKLKLAQSQTKRKRNKEAPYCAKLEKIKELMSEDYLPVRTVVKELGNDVTALGSVPAAILAFLRGSSNSKRIRGLEDKHPFERVVLYAISLGGDTDTIATMAAGMAGAFYGYDGIPQEWLHCCEGVEVANDAAEKLWRQHETPDYVSL